MVIAAFPPPDAADEDGLLAIGGDLEVSSLLLAYSHGIFPWPVDDSGIIPWFSPPERAVLFLNELHIPRSLAKLRRKSDYRFSIDTDFHAVIHACATQRRGETWITAQMIDAYVELHRAGHAHSIECYSGSDLVGGLYGVSIGLMFAGESMFYHESNASKLALWHLIEQAQQAGAEWIDCQQLTPLVASFGARLIPRHEFLALLGSAVAAENALFG